MSWSPHRTLEKPGLASIWGARPGKRWRGNVTVLLRVAANSKAGNERAGNVITVGEGMIATGRGQRYDTILFLLESVFRARTSYFFSFCLRSSIRSAIHILFIYVFILLRITGPQTICDWYYNIIAAARWLWRPESNSGSSNNSSSSRACVRRGRR